MTGYHFLFPGTVFFSSRPESMFSTPGPDGSFITHLVGQRLNYYSRYSVQFDLEKTYKVQGNIEKK